MAKNLIDLETGEVIENVVRVITDSQQEHLDKSRRTSVARNNFKKVNGEFNFITRDGDDELYSELSPQDRARLIYLASFLDYDGVLKDDNGTPLTKSKIFEYLGCAKNTFYKFYNNQIDSGMLIEKDYGILLKDTVFSKGELKNKERKNKIRIFQLAIRRLYEENHEKNLKHLSNVMSMIPFVNLKYNTLCINPLEKDPDKVVPMTLSEMSLLFGYTKARYDQVIDVLSAYRVGDMHMFGYFGTGKFLSEYHIMINPVLIYGGNISDIEMVKLHFRDNTKAIDLMTKEQRMKMMNGKSFAKNKQAVKERKAKNKSLKK